MSRMAGFSPRRGGWRGTAAMAGLGLVLAVGIVLALRIYGTDAMLSGRRAANIQAISVAVGGLVLGWGIGRLLGGVRAVSIMAVPGLLLLAAVTSHFSLVFPALNPAFDKGFGGLMLWGYGFLLAGGLASRR